MSSASAARASSSAAGSRSRTGAGHSVHGRSSWRACSARNRRVVVQPPGLFGAERPKGRRSAGFAGPLRVAEVRERASQAPSFTGRGPPRSRLPRAARAASSRARISGSQRGFAADRGEVLERPHRDELRIDRHRAERRVGRRFARRHLVDRQQLQNALSGAIEPPCHRLDVADFADAPAACRRNRKQRNQYPGAS